MIEQTNYNYKLINEININKLSSEIKEIILYQKSKVPTMP